MFSGLRVRTRTTTRLSSSEDAGKRRFYFSKCACWGKRNFRFGKVYWLVTGIPPTPPSPGISDLAPNCKIIYGLQRLRGKILSRKDLARDSVAFGCRYDQYDESESRVKVMVNMACCGKTGLRGRVAHRLIALGSGVVRGHSLTVAPCWIICRLDNVGSSTRQPPPLRP